jgi:glycosyltransferase involved in cell wall biosynthesis
MRWHVITCEYPPQVGGVSDCASVTAAALLDDGHTVHIWCPLPVEDAPHAQVPGIALHRDLGRFTIADLRRVGHELDTCGGPRRVLVHWVPHGYGRRSLNVPLALWLALRGIRHRDRIDLLVHEPFLAWSWRPIPLAVAVVHRAMLWLVARGAERVWVSIPAWVPLVKRYAPSRVPVRWLPMPAPLAVVDDAARVAGLRRGLAPTGERLVGHFSGHSPLITNLLGPAIEAVLRNDSVRIVLIGRGSTEYLDRFLACRPHLAGRIQATGTVDPTTVSLHLQACDVMLQPYPDGVSARRTTVVASLAHGAAVVTNEGILSEPLWREGLAVDLASRPDPDQLAARTLALLSEPVRRTALGTRARRLYHQVFDVQHTIARITERQSRATSPSFEGVAAR